MKGRGVEGEWTWREEDDATETSEERSLAKGGGRGTVGEDTPSLADKAKTRATRKIHSIAGTHHQHELVKALLLRSRRVTIYNALLWIDLDITGGIPMLEQASLIHCGWFTYFISWQLAPSTQYGPISVDGLQEPGYPRTTVGAKDRLL